MEISHKQQQHLTEEETLEPSSANRIVHRIKQSNGSDIVPDVLILLLVEGRVVDSNY